jgi:hypothetical protein
LRHKFFSDLGSFLHLDDDDAADASHTHTHTPKFLRQVQVRAKKKIRSKTLKRSVCKFWKFNNRKRVSFFPKLIADKRHVSP